MSKPYNGFPSWNAWNVSLWLNNDEGLYILMREAIRATNNRTQAVWYMHGALIGSGITKTPDGAPYSLRSIRLAMVGLE